MLKFALRPESVELSHSFVLAHCLQVARFFRFKLEVAPNRKGLRLRLVGHIPQWESLGITQNHSRPVWLVKKVC